MTNVHDILEKARAAGAKLQPSEAAVLFASAVRHAAAQGATIRPHLVQIDETGILHVAPFDELAPESDPGYLAPELHGPEAPKKTEPGAQVFAAGALGYELFTGKRASGLSPGPELTGPLAEVVRLALAADRRERFPDLQRLQESIEAVQPRAPAEGERSILSALRLRWSRPPPEKEALAKLIEKLQHLEEQVHLLGKAQTRLEAAQRETSEHLERFTEGQARLGKTRPGSAVFGPAVLAATVAVAAAIAIAWATGNLGGATRPAAPAAPAPQPAEAPPPDPVAAPDAALSELPPREVAAPGHKPDAGARAAAAPAMDAGAPEAAGSGPAPEAAGDALDAGVAPDASAAAVAAAPSTAHSNTPSTAAPTAPPTAPAPEAAPAPSQKASVTPPPARKRASPQAAMQHALAISQVRRGEAALEQGRADIALESFRAALENEANNPAAYRGLGMAYAMQGKDQQALQAYQSYLRLAPSAPDAREIRRSMAELKARSRLGAGEK